MRDNLAALPKTYVMTCKFDILRDDGKSGRVLFVMLGTFDSYPFQIICMTHIGMWMSQMLFVSRRHVRRSTSRTRCPGDMAALRLRLSWNVQLLYGSATRPGGSRTHCHMDTRSFMILLSLSIQCSRFVYVLLHTRIIYCFECCSAGPTSTVPLFTGLIIFCCDHFCVYYMQFLSRL